MTGTDQLTGARLQSIVNDFVDPLRKGEGYRPAAFEAVKDALARVGREWDGSDVIPKAIVHVILGLPQTIESASYLCLDDADRALAQKASGEIDALISRHIAPAESLKP